MSQDLAASFDRDIRQCVFDRLPHDPSQAATLQALPTGSLLGRYFNWLRRTVPSRPRRLLVSAELRANPKFAEYHDGFVVVSEAIKGGADLTPHLSKGVTVGFDSKDKSTTPLREQRDLDLLLNDWGIHHLHLGRTMTASGFIERTNDVLFVAFAPGEAYAIDIMEHGKWHHRSLLETVARNWPAEGLLHEIKGGLRFSPVISEEDHKRLRHGGVSNPVEIDGRLYFPRGFLTTAGTSAWATEQSNQIMHIVRRLAEDPGPLEAAVAAVSDPKAERLWRFVINDYFFGVQEATTNTTVELGDLRLVWL